MGALVIGAAGLVVVKAVILKMLPFDNKSEFQVVVDMPEGTTLETTNALLHKLSGVVAKVPEVKNYQGYAGTASPITFNGLVRQYYLRSGPIVGDLQVNLVDKHDRDATEPRHRAGGTAGAAEDRQAVRCIAEGGRGAAGTAGAGADRGRGLRTGLRHGAQDRHRPEEGFHTPTTTSSTSIPAWRPIRRAKWWWSIASVRPSWA